MYAAPQRQGILNETWGGEGHMLQGRGLEAGWAPLKVVGIAIHTLEVPVYSTQLEVIRPV